MPFVAMLLWVSHPAKAALLKRLHSCFDRIILQPPLQREYAIRVLGIPSRKVVPIRKGVDHRFWRPMPGLSDMICAVGSEMRDHPTLIEALRDVPIRCHIAAGTVRSVRSPWARAIEQTGPLPPHITVGKIPFGELRALYARSRFVVVPLLSSDRDNGASTIVEAMAMGKAVICTRTPGQVGILTDGETGIFVPPPRDPRALREAIRYLWERPDVAQRMGRAGRRVVEVHHTFDDYVGRIKSVVEEVIAEHRLRRAAASAVPSGVADA